MPHIRLFASMFAILMLAAFSAHAEAHAALVNADPAPDSAAAAPSMIELHFSETLEPRFSGFRVTKDGAPVDVGDVTLEKDAKTLMAMPGSPLPAGNYKISWHTVSDDAHKNAGGYSFTVK